MAISKKSLLKIIAYILLIASTFGVAFYGIVNEKTFDVMYKGLVYKEQIDGSFVNKDNHHIYVEEVSSDGSLNITITIENDNVILSIYNTYSEFKIEKSGVVFEGTYEDLEAIRNHQFQDYIDLINKYIDYETVMDEFPGSLVFSFFALLPFIFGFLLLYSIFKQRVKRPSILHYAIWTVLSILYVSLMVLLLFIVSVNTF